MMAVQHKLVGAALVAAVCALVPTVASADPIILNGSFSLGNTGFSSGYTYLTYPPIQEADLLRPGGTYTVGGNPRQVHDAWENFGDHTGDGSMMIINGSGIADVAFWSTTVDVAPDSLYDFSAWFTSTYPVSTASVAFSINGVALGAPLTLSSTPGEWQQFAINWYSGDQTTAVLSLVDLNTVLNGNDFAFDDVALTGPPPISTFAFIPEPQFVTPVPEPVSSVGLLSLGLGALTGLRRRWR